MASASRFFALLGPSILHNSHRCTQILPRFLKSDKFCSNPSMRLLRYSSIALNLDSDASAIPTADPAPLSTHPWPEWISFVDLLKSKGYLAPNAAVPESDTTGVSVYTEMKLVKDACLSFARDRFDVVNSLSVQDIQAIVEKGCPNLLRKAVNSSKRLRAYLKLDEGDVCSSCNLRGACDRAYVMLNNVETDARTVDVVRILLFCALDPLVFSGENKPPGRENIESSARKLLSKLTELGDTPLDPNLLNSAPKISLKKSLDLSKGKSAKNVDMKPGDWECIKQYHSCGYDAPRALAYDGEMKKGDWICPECSFMNFARNVQCLKCSAERPKNASVDGPERKKGDWDCPRCLFMNFASNRQCFRCQEPRPQRQLKPGDWECPRCDFLNFSRNTVCRKCNLEQSAALSNDEQTWKKAGDWECPKCDFLNFNWNTVCKKCNFGRPLEQSLNSNGVEMWKRLVD